MSNIAQPKSHKKLILIILLIMASLLSVVVYFGIVLPHQQAMKQVKINGILLPAATDIADFKLTDHHGEHFTQENLKGHWTLLFFGFTNCDYVCPNTMVALNKMYKTLQQELPDSKLPQVVLVSVDPERDTVKRMNSYVSAFNPHFIGVRADIKETIALEKQLHIAAAKMEADGEGKNHYTINHTAEILLVNPQGKLQAYLPYPHKADQLVKDYKLILTLPA